MRDWLTSLGHNRWLEVALALAVGYAVFTVAEAFASVTTNLLAQHLGREPFEEEGYFPIDLLSAPLYFNFEVGGTVVVYGPVLSALIAFGLVLLAGSYVVRRRDRELGTCPFCASRIPYDSTHCAYCGSGVEPGEPRSNATPVELG